MVLVAHSLKQVGEIAARNSDKPEVLADMARQCVLYAGGPSANRRAAHVIHLKIKRMLKRCQAATNQETTDTPPSPPSGSQKEALAEPSKTSEIMEAGAGPSSTKTTQPSPSSSSGSQQVRRRRATTKAQKPSSPPTGQGPEEATGTSTGTNTGSPSGQEQAEKVT